MSLEKESPIKLDVANEQHGKKARFIFNYHPPDMELEVDWLITNQCNFGCVYCYPQIKARIKDAPEFEKRPVEGTVAAIKSLGKKAHCIISGGEPFMFPDFVDLAVELTKENYLSVFTNFSTSNVYNFADRVNPERVGNIFPAYHALMRDNESGLRSTEEYIKKVIYFQERDFNVHGVYVLHPSVLDRFEEDITMLKSSGVDSINVKIFKGRHEGRTYPEAYTDEEKARIFGFQSNYPHNIPYMQGQRNFEGLRCNAGVKFVKIEPNGTVYRCASIPKQYGNIYIPSSIQLDEEPSPCTAKQVLTLTNCMSYLVCRPFDSIPVENNLNEQKS